MASPSRLHAADDATTTVALEAVFQGGVPSSVVELKAMQEHVVRLTQRVTAATVAIQVGAAQGSGVIVSADGYVLTAAHVSSEPGETAWLVLHDGTRVTGKTLGAYRTIDAGLLRINQAAPQGGWPHARMGDSSNVAPGQWCLAAGHPGGFQDDRPPVVRLGRILSVTADSFNTDCTLIGGDSGGPLFDMGGSVIGVNSRIGNPLNVNLHVPVNSYREQWERLARGEAWGYTPGQPSYIGVQGKVGAQEAVISRVFPGAPAALAGVQAGDIVLRFGGTRITDFAALQQCVADERPGTRVTLTVQRGEAILNLPVEIGVRPE